MLNLNTEQPLRPLLRGAFWLIWFGAILIGLLTEVLWFKSLCLVGMLCLGYARWIEPYRLQVKRYVVEAKPSSTQTIRVAFLSDFHAGNNKKSEFYQKMVERVLVEKPDVILLGGDFVEGERDSIKDLTGLQRLQAPLGVFSILGNHDFIDHPQTVQKHLDEWKVEDATNQSISLKTESPIELVALEDNWFGQPNLDLLKEEKKITRILLIHEPDELLEVEEGNADIIFIGHTHGGQVRLPGIGALAPLPQIVPRSYDRGLLQWKGMPVIISQGIGESGFGIRFFRRPQIVIVDLKA